MSVAECLGLAGAEPPVLDVARSAWPRWCAAEPELTVVGDPAELRAWTRSVSAAQKDAVIRALATRTVTEKSAATVLAWVLLPGATLLAHRLRDLDANIDELVAGQLWIEVARAHQLRCARIAATILCRTRREVCAELGIGDAGRRRDRSWASAVRLELPAATVAAEDEAPYDFELGELLADAVKDRAIIAFDVWLLWQLAQVADERSAPAHRGRMGLTTPGVIATVATEANRPAATLRKRAMRAIDRLQAYVAVREDEVRFAEWRARHPVLALTAREEMELAISDFDHERRLTGRVPDWVETSAAEGTDWSHETA